MTSDTTTHDVNTVVSGASLSLIGKVSGRLLSFVGDIILARFLGASVFGLYSIGWTIFRILQMVTPLGFPQSVVRFIPEFKVKKTSGSIKGLIISAYGLSFLSGLASCVIFYILAPWLSNAIFHKPDLIHIFRYFSLIFPFCSILPVASGLAKSVLNIKNSVLLEDIGQPLIGLVVIVLMVFTAKLTVQSAILAEIISFVISGSLGLFVIRKLFAHSLSKDVIADFSKLSSIIKYSIPTSLAGVFSIFVFWIDRILVGVLLASSENGIYHVISQLSMIFIIIYAAFNSILGPIFANLYAENNKERLEVIFRIGTKWNFYLGIIPFIIVLLNSSNILLIIFGPEYSLGWMSLIVLSVGQLVNCGTGSIGVLLLMSGHQRSWFWMTSISLVINTVMCLIMVPKIGIIGAAIGTSLSVGGMNIIATLYARWKIGIWPYDRRYRKGIIAGLFSMVIGYFFLRLPLPVLYSVIISCLVVGGTFFFFLKMQGFDPEDKQLVEQAEKRFGFKMAFRKLAK